MLENLYSSHNQETIESLILAVLKKKVRCRWCSTYSHPQRRPRANEACARPVVLMTTVTSPVSTATERAKLPALPIGIPGYPSLHKNVINSSRPPKGKAKKHLECFGSPGPQAPRSARHWAQPSTGSASQTLGHTAAANDAPCTWGYMGRLILQLFLSGAERISRKRQVEGRVWRRRRGGRRFKARCAEGTVGRAGRWGQSEGGGGTCLATCVWGTSPTAVKTQPPSRVQQPF